MKESKLANSFLFLCLPAIISAVIIGHVLCINNEDNKKEKEEKVAEVQKVETPKQSSGTHSCSKCGKTFKVKGI